LSKTTFLWRHEGQTCASLCTVDLLEIVVVLGKVIAGNFLVFGVDASGFAVSVDAVQTDVAVNRSMRPVVF
jgi:hypothetical protein